MQILGSARFPKQARKFLTFFHIKFKPQAAGTRNRFSREATHALVAKSLEFPDMVLFPSSSRECELKST